MNTDWFDLACNKCVGSKIHFLHYQNKFRINPVRRYNTHKICSPSYQRKKLRILLLLSTNKTQNITKSTFSIKFFIRSCREARFEYFNGYFFYQINIIRLSGEAFALCFFPKEIVCLVMSIKVQKWQNPLFIRIYEVFFKKID